MTSKKTIMVIDDDPLVLASLSRLLERSGYDVRAFNNAKDAVSAALMDDFDLVITDVRMPEINGIQAIRYIREKWSSKGKPAAPEIVITGYAKEYEEEARALKPHAFIHKPFSLDEFMDVVKKALEG